LQLVKKFPAFMEPESPSPYPQVPATCPYPESIILQTEIRKWGRIGRTLRNRDKSVERQALDWNLQGS
jgi:hypothetical protein